LSKNELNAYNCHGDENGRTTQHLACKEFKLKQKKGVRKKIEEEMSDVLLVTMIPSYICWYPIIHHSNHDQAFWV